MTRVYISLGSTSSGNAISAPALMRCRPSLASCRSPGVRERGGGLQRPPFYNLVVGADTELPLATLCQRLRAMEFAHGREPDAKKFAPRTLDLDLLLYGELVCETPLVLPRGEILSNAFVLWPLAELAPPCAIRWMAVLSVSCGALRQGLPTALPHPLSLGSGRIAAPLNNKGTSRCPCC